MMALDIKKTEANNIKSLFPFIDKEFGKGYSASKKWGDDSFFLYATQNGEIIGLTVGVKLTNNLGLLDLIVVKNEFRRNGIARTLFKKRLDEFNKMGCYNFKLNHWVRKENPVPILAIKNGFRKVNSELNFWAASSVDHNYSCAECGTPPCSCTCDIYEYKNLNLE